MTLHHNRNHTGSVKHRVNNYRASYSNSPVGATSQPGESTTSSKSAKMLRIIQINVEGQSHEKCQYLARLQRENDIDVAVLQETHVKEASSPQRYTIHGYDMTDATYHPKYGTATYVREDLNARSVVVDSHQSNSYVTAIKVSGSFKRSSILALCWSTWALHMTPSGRLGSWWSYQKPPNAKQQSDSSPALISQRNFRVFLGNQVSRKRILRNGLPQGSVLAPSFFNVYMSDLPPTESLKFGYADDWTLATQSKTFSHLESTLSRDIGHLDEYFDYWKLCLNAKKTVATCFHLNNKQAARKLKVTLAGEVLVHDFAPKYLGVTLDQSLTYRKHTENVCDKVKWRCNIISKLAGTDWGAPSSCTSQICYRHRIIGRRILCASVGKMCSCPAHWYAA